MHTIAFYSISFTLFLISMGCVQPEISTSKVVPPPKSVVIAPKSDFQASVTEGQVPLNVKFISKCTGEVTNWKWDFGDGEFAAGPSTQHTYSSEGVFSVSLAIEGTGGSDTNTKPAFIKVISDVISWKVAKDYIGQNKVIDGVVVGARYATNVRGKPTFLNFNNPYSGYFTCVLWDSDRPKFIGKFSSPPEAYFLQKHVRVKGLIEEYPKGSGVPEVILTDPSQIEVLEK